MKKIIENMKHHLDDYECMWNGIEDIYMNKTKEEIPNQFFFSMSGFCSFVYIKTNKAELKRMVSFGEGRTKQMYKYLSDIVGFQYRHIESKNFSLALNKAKKEIDLGYPVVLGALDMYYLDYFTKLYHKEHIPFHYVLMMGYDDESQCIYLYDCGRNDMIELSYTNLELAMTAEYKGLSKPNTICTIRMERPNDKLSIANKCLEDKALMFTEPKTNFLGIKGMQKLAKEFPSWDKEIGVDETKKIIKNMITFMGSVPTIPNKLLNIDQPENVVFMCSRDKMSKTLHSLGKEYTNEHWVESSKLFVESGEKFELMCNSLIDYLLNIKDNRNIVSDILLQIADLEYRAYKEILKGIA